MQSHPEQRRRSWYVQFFQLPWLPEALLRPGTLQGPGQHRPPARPDGLVIAPHVATNYRATINALAIQHRLPTIYATRCGFEGGLILYTARATEMTVRVASFVDHILRGARPGDLPVEYPTRFELVVDLKTAKAIGVTIPEAFLARADELIE